MIDANPPFGTRAYASLALLIDDQPMVAESVRRLLTGERDINLHYCQTPADAVALANQIRPTVILQDLVMPGIDGLEMVRQFRANASTAETPIVVLSATEEAHVKSHAFDAGANDYIVKLPARAEMLARIRYHSRAYVNQVQRNAAFDALHESQQQLMESHTTLSAMNQQLNEFIGMAAHDLRNPLSAVIGYSAFLMRDRQGPFTDQHRTFVERIKASSEFMLHLVNDLLDVTGVQAGRLTLDVKPVALSALIASNVALNGALASDKGIEITIESDVPDQLIACDGRRVEQVLNNLLTNAIKFSHSGTTIAVTVRVVGAEALISVRDHGQGIPAAEQANLFQPFGVTSVKGTRGEKSTGLGLLIAKKVVDAHQGRIWVDSEPGVGSTFFVALPIAHA
jgi:signal transduction histidine kinase